MPYELFLALRYLRSRRKRRLARATAVAAIGGIVMGVAALIVALALANGFREEMRDKILHGTAHLTVMRGDGQAMQNYLELAARIRRIPGVEGAAGTTYDGAVASGPRGSAYAVLRGVDSQSVAAGQELKNWLTEGSSDSLFESGEAKQTSLPNVVMGSELANRTGLHVGDIAGLLPATSNPTLPSKRLARVTGIFRSGLFEYDSAWVYLSLDAAAAFTGNAHTAALISVQLTNIDDVKDVARGVTTVLGNSYTTVDWQEANRPLFTALALERRMGIFIVGLIILIAMLNITTMLILVVVERRRDIAILKAMGAAKLSITALFVIEGAIIGTLGAAGGVILGVISCFIGNRYKLVSLPADVYSLSSIPFRPHLAEISLAVLAAFILSIIATIYPARAAARMLPAETLRDAG
ncbi:MAG TPA: ABC transporter permease [Pyrinomonadaceae bacterium]|nr:ABC transporter permease [Pyrinomonadaceae bacterium]